MIYRRIHYSLQKYTLRPNNLQCKHYHWGIKRSGPWKNSSHMFTLDTVLSLTRQTEGVGVGLCPKLGPYPIHFYTRVILSTRPWEHPSGLGCWVQSFSVQLRPMGIGPAQNRALSVPFYSMYTAVSCSTQAWSVFFSSWKLFVHPPQLAAFSCIIVKGQYLLLLCLMF